MDTREATNLVGEMLDDFLKAGPSSPDHIKGIHSAIFAIVHQIMESPKEATADYAATCKAFLAEVKKVKGMPTRAIFGDAVNENQVVSSSGERVAGGFPSLLATLTERCNGCIENYRKQSQLFCDRQIEKFQNLVFDFFRRVPAGGSKNKLLRSHISKINKQLRTLSKWPELFYIYKQTSFPAELEHVFALDGGAIAAIWHYSQADEEGEFQKTYDHRQRDNREYAARDNWAIGKGLMQPGSNGYLDEITLPKQEVGCCCYRVFVYPARSTGSHADREGRSGTAPGKTSFGGVARRSYAAEGENAGI